jgi:hypothetical protein
MDEAEQACCLQMADQCDSTQMADSHSCCKKIRTSIKGPKNDRKGAVCRLRPKLMTVTAVLASLVPIVWKT